MVFPLSPHSSPLWEQCPSPSLIPQKSWKQVWE